MTKSFWTGRQKAILSGIKSVFGKERSSAEAASIEDHADPLFPAPDDVAGQVLPVGPEHQREFIGDAHRAGHLERRPDIRHVANHAIDPAAAELDRSGLQDAMTREDSLFIHEGKMRPTSKHLAKAGTKSTSLPGPGLISC